MIKPVALPVLADRIPAVLRAQHRWVTWRFTWDQKANKQGRWTKPPAGKTNDPSTWLSFDAALKAHQDDARTDGIGFCLGDGWAGIDLDDLTTGPVVDRLPCYHERSPSGDGVKAIGRSHRIGGEINFAVTPPARTPWTNARFFAVTGHGDGDPTIDITDLLNEWFPATTMTARQGLPAFVRAGDTRGTEQIERFTDDQVLERVLATPQADKFIRLVKGDVSDYGGDHSRADQALCCILAYWCSGDLEQVDRLFRQSALMRDKWNSASYRRATLAKAVAS